MDQAVRPLPPKILSILVGLILKLMSMCIMIKAWGRNPEKSTEPSASLSVDSNTSQSVCSNLYLVWLVDVFLSGVVSIDISMGR